MNKDEEEKISLEDDFILPNLEEDLNIDEIPTIDEVFSIDKDEVAEIQKLALSSSAQEEILENRTEEAKNTSAYDDENPILSNGQDVLNKNFNNSLNDINITFDDNTNIENSALTSDFKNTGGNNEKVENFNTSEVNLSENDNNAQYSRLDSYDLPDIQTENLSSDNIVIQDENSDNTNETVEQMPVYDSFDTEISDVNEEPKNKITETSVAEILSDNTEMSHDVDNAENSFNDNTAPDTSTDFTENNYNESDKDEQNNFEETIAPSIDNAETAYIEQSLQDGDVFAQIDALLNIETTVSITNFSGKHSNIETSAENETAKEESVTSLPETIDYTQETSSSADISDLADEISEEVQMSSDEPPENTIDYTQETSSSADISDLADEISEEVQTQHYQSSFNPVKYMQETPLEKEKTMNEEILDFLCTEEEVPVTAAAAEEQQQTPVLNTFSKNPNNTKIIMTVAVCAVVIGSAIIGISAFNRKSAEEIAELNKNDITTPLESAVSSDTAEDASSFERKVIDENTNVSSDIPNINTVQQSKVDTGDKDVIKEEIKKRTQSVNTESYLSVRKIQWQIPNYLYYSSNINSYLQTAGKSIKLQLLSDLLLVNEYAYSNLVKVSLKLSNTGVLQNTAILTSSGSKQIDDIVLQSVKSTLNVLKLPAGEVKTTDVNLIITIYF